MKQTQNCTTISRIRIFLLGLGLVGAAALTGCDAQSDRADSATPLERAIEPQLDALKKAENVEDSLQEQLDQRDKAMREQGT
ncbi:hypothetical protein [Arenicella xantha]|uniref:Secreted protein n=1 Tax=Arenicella xantha TaxID=644221 RepID=A0A395JM62_9GAMM|nr:hypothetical protein [Arenicella xantha]RBP51699.1 hypothetical protein DFR28_1021132 [Arenicella xantha]